MVDTTAASVCARSSVRGRRVRWLAGLLAVVMMCGPLVFAARASAHSVLESSSPAAGEVVPAGRVVSVVELRFDEPVEVSLGSVRVVAADGHRVDLGRVYHPGGVSSRVAVGVRPGLAAGSYLVLWRVVSANSHLARLGLLVAVAVTVCAARRVGRPGRVLSGLLPVELVGVVGTVAVEGHTAAGPWPAARVPLDVAHVAAVSVWLGGVATLAVVALPVARRPATVAVPPRVRVETSGALDVGVLDEFDAAAAVDRPTVAVQAAVARFSTVALACVLVLVTSGLLAAGRGTGRDHHDALRATAAGQGRPARCGVVLRGSLTAPGPRPCARLT